MVDLKILEERGISGEAWKKLLQGRTRPPSTIRTKVDPPARPSDKLDALVNRIWSRMEEARSYNLGNFKMFHTMDLLWGAPYRHISPTLVASLFDRYEAGPAIENAVKFFGYDVNKVLTETMSDPDPKTGETKKQLNYPAFFAITIPMVRAYLQVRRAKILNDRNLDPFISFEPAYNNQEDRIRCEVLSSAGHAMAKQMGYLEILNQAIFQMLLYGRCWVFPREEWFTEEQLRYVEQTKEELEKPPEITAPPSGFPETGIFAPPPTDPEEVDTKKEKYVTKQGIRLVLPHPSRAYWDKAYPAKTINPDVGVSYCGHWEVVRMREILANKGYYNTDRIYAGSGNWWDGSSYFFNSVYNQCVMRWPSFSAPDDCQDRELWLADNSYYTSDMGDMSVFLCQHYEKLIPSEEGLGNYDHPIWARFACAGDGTIIYAAPVGYTPAMVFEDNMDAKRLEDASMALQLAPFQDQLTNLTSQYLLSVRQNLANLTLVDKNVVKGNMMEKIRNLGEMFFRSLNIFEIDSKILTKAQFGVGQAIFSHRFPYLDTNAIITAIRMTLDLAERVGQFSSQEIAQSATHEQTRAEIDVINNTTSNILAYTGIPVDYAMEAWGRMIYQALMNFGEDDFIAAIPTMHKVSADDLRVLGFTVLSEPKTAMDKFKVKVKKTAMQLLAFAYIPDPTRRITNLAAANALANFMRDVMNNPITGNAIGADQAIQIANQIATMAGLRLARPLQNVGLTPEQQALQSQQFLKQIIDTVTKATDEKIMPINDKIDALIKALKLEDVVPTGKPEANGNGQTPVPGPVVAGSGGQTVQAPVTLPHGR